MATELGLDDVLSAIGIGLWQLPVFVLSIFTQLVIPVHMIGSTILSAPVNFRCSSTGLFFENATNSPTYSDITKVNNISSGHPTGRTDLYDNKCLPEIEFDQTSFGSEGVEVRNGEDDSLRGHATGLVTCPWVLYDDSVFTSTVITEWHLICERDMLRPLFQMMYSIGALFGSIVGGQISDSLGRKRAVQIGSFINLSATVILYIMPWYTGALLARVLIGGTSNFIVLPAYSLSLEISPPKYRTLVGMLLGTAFSVGIIILAGLGYFIRSWKPLMLLDAGVPFLFLIPLTFWVTESPRWLIQHNEAARAAKIMSHAVIVNKVVLDRSTIEAIEGIREKADLRSTESDLIQPKTTFSTWWTSSCRGFLSCLRSKGLRTIILISPLVWVLQGCLYLGIILNANNFTSNNPFIYISVSGAMDLIAILLATPLSVRLGRKVLMCGAFFVAGVLLIVDVFVPVETLLWLKFMLVMTSLLLTAASYQINFMYTPELYPTVMRARGFAFSCLAGNVGFLMAPLITDFLSSLASWSVNIAFGCGGILACLLMPFLPETLNKPLPETTEDVDTRYNTGRGRNPLGGMTRDREEEGEVSFPLKSDTKPRVGGNDDSL